MITCSNCECPDFVQITQSRIYYEVGSEPSELMEEYECTLCGGTGRLSIDNEAGEKEITGDIVETVERPRAEI